MEMEKSTKLGLSAPSEMRTKVLTESQIANLLKLHDSPMVRMLYLVGGFLALFLGILGAVLPILPEENQ